MLLTSYAHKLFSATSVRTHIYYIPPLRY